MSTFALGGVFLFTALGSCLVGLMRALLVRERPDPDYVELAHRAATIIVATLGMVLGAIGIAMDILT